MLEKKDCCICGDKIEPEYDLSGNPFWFGGHNAEPVKFGRCCELCNQYEVIPTRIARLFRKEITC